MIFRHVGYDAQFSFVIIYKVGKYMMPSVLKICSDFKSCVVYFSLKPTITPFQKEIQNLCKMKVNKLKKINKMNPSFTSKRFISSFKKKRLVISDMSHKIL